MTKPKPKLSPRGQAAVVAFTLVVIGALVGGPLVCARWARTDMLESAGSPGGATWLDGDDGVQLLILDQLQKHKQRAARVRSVDPRTGAVTGRWFQGPGATVRCRPAGKRHAWCQDEARPGRWIRLEPRTLGDQLEVVPVVRRAKLGHIAPRAIEIRRQAAYVTLEDGRVARVDADTLAVTIEATYPPYEGGNHHAFICGGPDRIEVAGTVLALRGEPRTAVVVGDGAALEQGGGAGRGADFLVPKFLNDHRTGAPLDVGAGAIVLHASSLDPGRATTRISRVDLTGAIVWTTDVGPGCELATLIDGLLVLTVGSAGPPRALALDPATGAVRWRLER